MGGICSRQPLDLVDLLLYLQTLEIVKLGLVTLECAVDVVVTLVCFLLVTRPAACSTIHKLIKTCLKQASSNWSKFMLHYSIIILLVIDSRPILNHILLIFILLHGVSKRSVHK